MTEQRDNRRTERVVVYVTADWHQHLAAVTRDDFERADWLRRALENAIGESEIAADGGETEKRRIPAEVQLAAAQERIKGLEEVKRNLGELIAQQREWQGMSDSLSQELTKRLEEAHSTVDRITLMLPAAGQTGQRWWKFW